MSMYYKEHGKPEVKKYTKHGKTKQSQKDETDINKLLERSARTGALSHLDQFQGQYGDFLGYDFEAHINTIAEGQSIFEHLPAEVKREFDQSAQKFFEYVTNPDNKDRLPELLPELANRGDYLETLAPAPVVAAVEPEPAPEPSPEPEAEPASEPV